MTTTVQHVEHVEIDGHGDARVVIPGPNGWGAIEDNLMFAAEELAAARASLASMTLAPGDAIIEAEVVTALRLVRAALHRVGPLSEAESAARAVSGHAPSDGAAR